MKKNKIANNFEVLQFPLLDGCDTFHFVTTRQGGVSKANYESLNFGRNSGDKTENINRNFALLENALADKYSELVYPRQSHTDRILNLNQDFFMLSDSEQTVLLQNVDGLITNQKGVCIVVTTADCVPLLFYAPDKKVVAAVHAGWRGTALKIASKCVDQMHALYGCDPAELLVGIGPSISQVSFEVGDEVVESFEKVADAPKEEWCYIDDKSGKPHVDLWQFNKKQLMGVGVLEQHIEVSGLCSFIHKEDFFSARRMGIKCGRMLSGIFLKKEI